MAAELNRLAEYFANKGSGYADLVGTTRVAAREAERLGVHELPFEQRIPSLSAENVVFRTSQTTSADIYIPRPVEGLILPSSEQLVGAARRELKTFFGQDIMVPEPPAELFHTLERFAGLGIRGFEPQYLPQLQLREKDNFPGLKVKPGKWFWDCVKDGSIEKGADTLDEGWYLLDGRWKPNYRDGQQVYEDDYLAPLMENLRASGRIQPYRYVPRNSRFGASPLEIEQVILPEFAKQTQPEGEVSNMSYALFSVIGNMKRQEWNDTTTWQWFRDKFEDGRRLIGGSSHGGGLAGVGAGTSDYRFDHAGFAPVVAFSSKTR